MLKQIRSTVAGIYHDVAPVALQWQVARLLHPSRYKLREEVIAYFKQQTDAESQRICKHIERNLTYVFPYEFTKKYRAKTIQVFDDPSGMKYVLHENKKMFFPTSWTRNQVRGYYNGLLIEQDMESPHRYETANFQVKQGDVLADIGAAEGIFALTNIEKVSKVFLFEYEDYWIEVLQKTFEPWKEKVQIVKKYISNKTNDNEISFDDFLSGDKVDFIKADIEGAEMKLLSGAKKTLSSNPKLKMVVTTYHHANDAEDLKIELEQQNFRTEFSNGHMIFIYDKKIAAPYLRKAVLRATKTQF